MNYSNILTEALDWAKKNSPNASTAHQCAFANSVAYLVTGASGGYGGPSMREHLVAWSLAAGKVEMANVGGTAMTMVFPDGTLPRPGEWGIEEAYHFAAPLCFGDAEQYKNLLFRIREQEYCFDDDESDLALVGAKKQ